MSLEGSLTLIRQCKLIVILTMLKVRVHLDACLCAGGVRTSGNDRRMDL